MLSDYFKKFKKRKNSRQSLVNIVDLIGLGLFFVIGITAAAFLLRRADFVYVTLRISDRDKFNNFWANRAPEWYLEHLDVGLKDTDIFGRLNLSIEEVYYYPSHALEQTTYVVLKVRSTFNSRTNQYSFSGRPLLVGDQHIFNLETVEVPGVIHRVSPQIVRPAEQKFVVRGELKTNDNEDIAFDAETVIKGVPNYLARRLEPGLKLESSDGRTMATILEVDTRPGERQFIAGSQLSMVTDPERTQVRLTIELSAQRVNGRYLYREDVPIVVNNKIHLDFPDFPAVLTITDIVSGTNFDHTSSR